MPNKKKASKRKKGILMRLKDFILQNKFDIGLVTVFFLISLWLMDKSLMIDSKTATLLVARNEVGDFGLHLGLIESFAKGNNFPPQLPFFPNQPLPYHYLFDLLTGLLVRGGLPLVVAFNGLSAVALTVLLYLLYKFPQMLFGKSKLLGALSVLLFLFPSSLTFVDFFQSHTFGPSLLTALWRLPDYIHKGPFDGSIISIFFTLNVYLNQRHLIAGMAVGFFLLYYLINHFLRKKEISWQVLFLVGTVLGILMRVHALIFIGTSLTIFCLAIVFKKYKQVIMLSIPTYLIFLTQVKDIIVNKTSHPYINPGFLVAHPIVFQNVFTFWFLNLGFLLFLIPISLFFVGKIQKKIFFAFLPLFILPNILQFSYRIEHNHSLINFFFTFANFYVAFFLVFLWKKKIMWKLLAAMLFVFLIISGIINMMPIKNDYHYPFVISPKNTLMQWIQNNTNPSDIFLEKADLFDPVVLSGRRNYFGNLYYISVMGYNYTNRVAQAKTFFQADTVAVLQQVRKAQISYIIIPLQRVDDFPYTIHKDFLEENLRTVYKDKNVEVLKF